MNIYNPEDNTITITDPDDETIIYSCNINHRPGLANRFRAVLGLDLFPVPPPSPIKYPSRPKPKIVIVDTDEKPTLVKFNVPPPRKIKSPSFDPLDQEQFEDEYVFISNLLKELHPRQQVLYTMKWIIYKKEMDEDTRDNLIIDIEESSNPQEFLDELLKSISDETLLEYWYQHFKPAATKEKVMSKMVKYASNPAKMWSKLYAKYF